MCRPDPSVVLSIGRRISKTINGTTTQYVYDGLDIIQEIQGSNKTNYIRTLNIDEPLTRIKADGTVRHYVNALGSVIALTDDSGIVKTTYTYDPFGNVTVSGEASDNPFQYTGRENDGTGLYYYRARYYSPELQRFISEDPIGLAGGINLYSYVANSPVNFVDPFGLSRAIYPPGLPRGGLPGTPGAPDAPDVPRNECGYYSVQICELVCNGVVVKDKCYVGPNNDCHKVCHFEKRFVCNGRIYPPGF